MIEELFQIPVFLFGLMYVILPSAIPILIMLYVIRKIANSGKKTVNSFR